MSSRDHRSGGRKGRLEGGAAHTPKPGEREPPPRLGQALARWILPSDVRNGVLVDLEHELARRAAHQGRVRARLWYWKQVLASIPSALLHRGRGVVGGATARGGSMARGGATARGGTLLLDLRLALRQMRRDPGFAAVVVLTLGLGIGANTAVFTVVDGVLLAELPYAEPQLLVRLYLADRDDSAVVAELVTGMHYLRYRERQDLFAGLAGFYTSRQEGIDLTGGDVPVHVVRLSVSSEFFDVLGVEPMIGRGFHRDEEHEGARLAVLGHGLWRRRFGADPELLERTVRLDDEPYSVVGVMPPDFVNPIGGAVEMWTPQELRPGGRNSWDNFYLTVVGRLREGVSLERAEAELAAMTATFPSGERWSVRLVSLHEDTVGEARSLLMVLMAAVGMVLLLACVNVANLYLARAAERTKELAVRAAMGADRRRLLSQLLAESCLLGLAGGAAGLIAAWWGVRALLAMSPTDLPRVATVSMDARMLAFTAAVSLLAGLLFGLGPALRFSRPDLERWLRAQERGSTRAPVTHRLRAALAVAEIAIAVVLLVAAGFLIRSFLALQRVELGFDPEGVLTFEVHLPEARYGDVESRAAFQEELERRLRAQPGLLAMGAVSHLPVEGPSHQWGARRLDLADPPHIPPNMRLVSGDYFGAMEIPLLEGRLFDDTDRAGSPERFLINELFAERFVGDRPPVGTPIGVAAFLQGEVVGVVGDTVVDPRGTVPPMIYMPYAQFADNTNFSMIQVVRGRGEPGRLVESIRAELRAIDPDLVLHRPRPMADVAAAATAAERFGTTLMSVFSAMALLLAAVGVYGVLAQTVGARSFELGIRMALGARHADVLRMVLSQALLLAVVGAGMGAAAAMVLGRWMSSLTFAIDASDPLVFLAVGATLAVVALAAAVVPARRATAVDPVTALRDR